MKLFAACILLLLLNIVACAQAVLIHSHNDYVQREPLANAFRNKVYSLEADVFLVNGELKVAHDKKDLASAPSLAALYLQPIIELFEANHGRVSSDSNYAPILLIDIKEDGEATLTALAKLLSLHPSVFDRKVNRVAVQVVISGVRGNPAQWASWPSFMLFDGRASEEYDINQMERVAFFSDSYLNYASQKNSTDSLIRKLAERVHQSGKLLRLWAIPDNPAAWTHMRHLGVDIINTDSVTACRKYFSAQQ